MPGATSPACPAGSRAAPGAEAMELLIVNSNATRGITDQLATEARRIARPDTRIRALTATDGPAAIESPADVDRAARATRAEILSAPPPVDAAIIACFSDPGLLRIRAEVAFPVIGIAEAAMLRACVLGPRFTVLTVAPATLPGIRDTARCYGLEDRMAGAHALDQGVLQSHRDPEGTARRMADLARQVLREEAPDVLILGGAITAGLGRRIAGDLPVPVLDGLSCAVERAEELCGRRAGA